MPRRRLPRGWSPRVYAVLLAAALCAAYSIIPSYAQSDSMQSDEPEADSPVAEPSAGDIPDPESQVWPLSPESSGALYDGLLGSPSDFAVPTLDASKTKIDPSKFTAVKPVSTGWTAKAGVDYAPATPATSLSSSPLLPNMPPQSQSGPAWANVTAPPLDTPLTWDNATLETRFDPRQNQGTFGMKFSRSMPLGSELSLTWQNDYSLTQPMLGTIGPVSSVPTTIATTTATGRELDTNQALKFNFLPSSTSFSFGATRSSTDTKWLPSFSAEQKVFGGPINITGSVSQTATGEVDKTLTGGFKRSW